MRQAGSSPDVQCPDRQFVDHLTLDPDTPIFLFSLVSSSFHLFLMAKFDIERDDSGLLNEAPKKSKVRHVKNLCINFLSFSAVYYLCVMLS